MNEQYKSEALAAAHETALGLAEAGLMARRTMKVFDEMCLTAVEDMAPARIREIRMRENASQAVFARYLNVTAGLVSPVGARREAAPRRFAKASDVGREERPRVGRLIGLSPVASRCTARSIVSSDTAA